MGLSDVVKSIKTSPVRKYEQRFLPEKYKEVITTQNQARVARLNELSDIVNAFTDASMFTELELKKAINEAYNLIYGMGEIDFYPSVDSH